MGSDGEDPDSAAGLCAVALTHLSADRPEAALTAARRAVALDPSREWAHRLASLALERLGSDAEAVREAEEAARLAPGSWQARLRLGAALRRVPGRWREAADSIAAAARFAPEEPEPHAMSGDLALLRGEHRPAEAAYLAALRRNGGHTPARVNYGLALLRWDPPRAHHDPAWSIDPRETGRARRALEVWSRQARLLPAVATAVSGALVVTGPVPDVPLGLAGAIALVLVGTATVRQARRVRIWSTVPVMLGRDRWLGLSVATACIAVVAYTASLLVPLADPIWAGLAGIVLLNAPALAVLRVLTEAWRGRPVLALAQLSTAYGERAARRDLGVTLWIVLARAWSGLAALAVTAIVAHPVVGLGALAVPYLLVRVWGRGGLAGLGALRADRWLAVAAGLALTAALACVAAAVSSLVAAFAGGGEPVGVWAWRVAFGATGAVAAVFALRALRAWWRGAPGPWRASLIMAEPVMDGVREPVTLTPEIMKAFTFSREVVLACADPLGPRALAVGAVVSVTPSGELRLIAGAEAWEAAERDPRVALFAADPLHRRFWAEVRGVALPDPETDVLRVTPKQVLVGEFPGRHQRR
ncbi:tetratricopeptide repeat protein [Nonomuraea sp. bgisy101]|uniref:tetratricopeptide repeat protein n=1 Tax=Nonomuraea sp. bgisy101 TaxID=3413784 RepID=UPI003D718C65